MHSFHRIVVIGNTGSGKTTLARELARRLDRQQIELDSLHWEPNWTPAPKEVFRERAAEATSRETWVADGNYSSIRDIVWSRAETVVWLDYPLPIVLTRLFRRTFRRIVTRQELWNGNRENLRDQLSRESLFLWALKTYRRHRREYPDILQTPPYDHLTVIRLRSPRETERWLNDTFPLRPQETAVRG